MDKKTETTLKVMRPDDFRRWLTSHNYTITGFCRMTLMQRRVMQRRLHKRAFTPHYGLLLTTFCHAYDLGFHPEGLGDPTTRPPGGYRGGRPRKLKIAA